MTTFDIRRNYLVEIVTATLGTFRWTPSRARTRDGRIGLIYAGNYYEKVNIAIPDVDFNSETPAGSDITITVGSADGLADDLVFDSSALLSAVKITRLRFGDNWEIVGADVWYSGQIGRTWIDGEVVTIDCFNDSGRRRGSGARPSQSLMLNHTPHSRGVKIKVYQ